MKISGFPAIVTLVGRQTRKTKKTRSMVETQIGRQTRKTKKTRS